jgi:trimeric autotransporter adhesin
MFKLNLFNQWSFFRNRSKLSKGLLFFVAMVYGGFLMASPNTITFQSRIVKPDGAPLENNAVNFRMSLTDTVGSCVIYQEDFVNRNMAGSKGLINLSLGTGTKVYPAGPMTMLDVFNNYNSPMFVCQAGGSINAGPTDRRKLIVQFNDGSGWQTVPAMDINSTPFSMHSMTSQKLGDYPAGDYLRTAALPSCGGGQALHFDGSSITCVSAGGGGGGSYSAITGATGINAIDNTNFAQTWNWSTATTQNPMTITANALTTGSMLNLTTSNNTLNSTNGLLNVANTGTSTTGVVARIQSNSTAGSGLTVLANGNVGVGTTNPSTKLEVAGASTIRNDGIAVQYIRSFGNGSSPRPILSLVSKRGTFAAPSDILNGDKLGEIGFGDGSNMGAQIMAFASEDFISGNASSGGNLRFYTVPIGINNAAERMRIDAAGNVGIGTASPNRLLEVAGPVRISPTVLPGSPAAGDIAVDSGDSNKLKVYNGSAWQTSTSTASGSTNRIPKYTSASTLGDSAITDNGTVITATRSIASITNTVGAAAVDLSLSNTHTLAAVGGAAITITNPSNGGVYNIIVTDTTARTYTFTGCTASYFKPANAPTTAATRTVYGLMTVDNGGGGWDCYITWSSGFQ